MITSRSMSNSGRLLSCRASDFRPEKGDGNRGKQGAKEKAYFGPYAHRTISVLCDIIGLSRPFTPWSAINSGSDHFPVEAAQDYRVDATTRGTVKESGRFNFSCSLSDTPPPPPFFFVRHQGDPSVAGKPRDPRPTIVFTTIEHPIMREWAQPGVDVEIFPSGLVLEEMESPAVS